MLFSERYRKVLFMAKAYVGDVLIAESDETIVVEGNHYFPPQSVKREYLTDNSRETACPWKGLASYYDLQVDGKTLSAAGWYYPAPKQAAAEIKDYVAFYPVVKVSS